MLKLDAAGAVIDVAHPLEVACGPATGVRLHPVQSTSTGVAGG